MKIWVFHHHADPPDGHWTYTHILMAALAKRGHDITVFSSSFSHYSRCDERLSGKEKYRQQIYDSVKFVFVKTSPYFRNDIHRVINMVRYSWRSFRYALRMQQRPDVVIGAWPPPFGSTVAEFIARKHKAVFLYEVHDLWPVFLIESGILREKSVAAFMLGKLQMAGLAKSHGILALWPRMYQYFELLGIPEGKTTWLPMGVNFAKLSLPPPPHEKSENEPFIVMYRGRFGNTNDIETMIECARICRERGLTKIKFIFVGDGPERKRFEEMAELLDNVHFEGFVPHEKILEDTARADVLIGSLPDLPHFGKYGMISTKLIEYLAANRPMIFATNDKEHVVATAGVGLVVPPKNASAFADAVVALSLTTHTERCQMGLHGIEYLRRYHDIEVLADRIENVINILLTEVRKPKQP